MRGVYHSSLIDHSRRTVQFSPRARTVSLKRGGRLRVKEEVKDGRKRKQRGRGRKRKRVRLMVGTSLVDLDLIEIILLCFRYPGVKCTVKRGNPR